MDILDAYVLSEPSPQNIIDLFKEEWSSKLPDNFGLITKPGTAALFEDSRVIWAEETFGGFSGFKILELGPLEGGHSYMFQTRNAQKVIAIEANSRAFLKCLCIKEVFNLSRVEFKLGDFMPFLEKDSSSSYDLVFASGVLYHMQNPIQLLKLISKVTDRLFIWTHYYDAKIIENRADLRKKFKPMTSGEYEGFLYEYSTQSYNEALNWSGFCGGSAPISKWLTRSSILEALERFGFQNVKIDFEHPDHPNGPAFAICASKSGK